MSLERVKALAYQYFNDHKRVDLWLNAPNPVLKGNTPLEMIKYGKEDKLITLLEDRLTN